MKTKTLNDFEVYENFPIEGHTCYVRPSEAQDIRLAQRNKFRVAYLSLDSNDVLNLQEGTKVDVEVIFDSERLNDITRKFRGWEFGPNSKI
ncbi:Uncharacterised protein [uncultured archaeon]|nr:Uncharacterised protein [uncultured archaeon]